MSIVYGPQDRLVVETPDGARVEVPFMNDLVGDPEDGKIVIDAPGRSVRPRGLGRVRFQWLVDGHGQRRAPHPIDCVERSRHGTGGRYQSDLSDALHPVR